MKKLLVVTPRFPFPVVGGDRLRIYEVCKELSKEFELTLLSLCEYKNELDKLPAEDKVFSRIEIVYLPKWRSYTNCLLGIFSSNPLQISYYKSKKLEAELDKLLDSHDAVLAHLVRTGQYLLDANKPKILEMTDAISLNYERVSKSNSSKGVKHLIYALEQKRLKRYEKRVASYFDCSVMVSQVDKDYLYSSTDDFYNRVLVCSNGVNTAEFEFEPSFNSKKLVFIGNLYSVQNLDAALWFAKHVMPTLATEHGYSFNVIGRIRDRDKKKFDGLAGTELTGEVPSIGPHVKDALAGVCSVRLGAGIQNKVLEYMSFGLPCITTSIGLEGFTARPEHEVLVANTKHEFCQQIQRLSAQSELHDKIAKNGRNYVQRQHSWSAQLEPLRKSIRQLLQGKNTI